MPGRGTGGAVVALAAASAAADRRLAATDTDLARAAWIWTFVTGRMVGFRKTLVESEPDPRLDTDALEALAEGHADWDQAKRVAEGDHAWARAVLEELRLLGWTPERSRGD